MNESSMNSFARQDLVPQKLMHYTHFLHCFLSPSSRYYKHKYVHTYIYIPWIHKFVTKAAECGTSHKYASIHIFLV